MGHHTSHQPDAFLLLLTLACLASLLAVFIFWLCTRSPSSEREPLYVQTPPRWPPPYDRSGRRQPPTPPTPDSAFGGRRSSRRSRHLNNPSYYEPVSTDAQPDITTEPIATPRMPAFGSQRPPALMPDSSQPPADTPPPRTESALSAPGNLGPCAFNLFDWNYFHTVRSHSAPAVLARHEHMIRVAESPEQESEGQMNPYWWPLVPSLQLVGEATPPLRPSMPRSMRRRQQPMTWRGAPENPPETLPDGRPHPLWDPAGHFYWPYIPDEYERMLHPEVEMRLLEEFMRAPERSPVWPEGYRPLAPHWYPGGRDKPEDLCFPFRHLEKPPRPGDRPVLPVRNLRMLVDYDAFLKARRNAFMGKNFMRWTSSSSSEVAQLNGGYDSLNPLEPRRLFGRGTDIEGHKWASACAFKRRLCACRPGEAGRREGRMGICFYCAKFFVDPAVKRMKLPPRHLSIDRLKIDPCTPQLACLMTDWAAFILQDATRRKAAPAKERSAGATGDGLQAVRDGPGFKGSFWRSPSKRAAGPRRAYSLRDPAGPPRPTGTQVYRWMPWADEWVPVHWCGTASAPALGRDETQHALQNLDPLTRGWARNAYPQISERVSFTLEGRTSVRIRRIHA